MKNYKKEKLYIVKKMKSLIKKLIKFEKLRRKL